MQSGRYTLTFQGNLPPPTARQVMEVAGYLTHQYLYTKTTSCQVSYKFQSQAQKPMSVLQYMYHKHIAPNIMHHIHSFIHHTTSSQGQPSTSSCTGLQA